MEKDKNILIPNGTSTNIDLINLKIKNGEKISCIGRNSLGIVIHFKSVVETTTETLNCNLSVTKCEGNERRDQLIAFATWWMNQGYWACIVEKEVDEYLKGN